MLKAGVDFTSENLDIWRVRVEGIHPRRLVYLSEEVYIKVLGISKKYRSKARRRKKLVLGDLSASQPRQAGQIYFNYFRTNRYRGNKSPVMILRERFPEVNEGVLNLPPIRLESMFDLWYKDKTKTGYHVPKPPQN